MANFDRLRFPRRPTTETQKCQFGLAFFLGEAAFGESRGDAEPRGDELVKGWVMVRRVNSSRCLDEDYMGFG